MSEREKIKRNFVGINDTTLREGEQYNGTKYTLDDQIEILSLLAEIGVDTAEVGNPSQDDIFEELKVLTKLKKRPRLMAHIRNHPDDLNKAIEAGVEGVHILCAVDPARLATLGKTGQTLEDHTQRMIRNVIRAQDEGLEVRVSVEHGLKEEFFEDTLELLRMANSLGVDRVQVADTRGELLPWEVTALISLLRQEVETNIGVHAHNDFLMASANIAEALRAGANWVDTTLLGAGERTGISALSTILSLLYHIDPEITEKYSLHLLKEAEEAMARILGMEIPHNLITSDTAFSHKAGIHVRALEKQGNGTYEAIEPEVVGNKRIIVTDSRISGNNGRGKK